jgi:hypothetical protein
VVPFCAFAVEAMTVNSRRRGRDNFIFIQKAKQRIVVNFKSLSRNRG